MTDKFRNKYRIASARLQNWDYRWNAPYFITICTQNRENYFGEIVNDKMILSNQGILADVFWYEIKNHSLHVVLDRFTVMPNHIHGILILNGNDYCNDNDDSRGNGGTVETRYALSRPSQPPSQPKTIGQTRFQNQGKNSVSSIIGSYKSAVTNIVTG